MTDEALNTKINDIYASLEHDNQDIDKHILELKILLFARGEKTIAFETAKLAQPNRQGRKMMQSYFKKRGVNVTFTGAAD
jgi:hypothetical protein